MTVKKEQNVTELILDPYRYSDNTTAFQSEAMTKHSIGGMRVLLSAQVPTLCTRGVNNNDIP